MFPIYLFYFIYDQEDQFVLRPDGKTGLTRMARKSIWGAEGNKDGVKVAGQHLFRLERHRKKNKHINKSIAKYLFFSYKLRITSK